MTFAVVFVQSCALHCYSHLDAHTAIPLRTCPVLVLRSGLRPASGPRPLVVVAGRWKLALPWCKATGEGAHRSQRRTTPDPGLAHAPTKAM